MSKPILDTLAKEIFTVSQGKKIDYSDLIYNIRNNEYPREELIRDLAQQELSFFAGKLKDGYYDRLHKQEKELNGKTNT